jgi:hypothetical protein
MSSVLKQLEALQTKNSADRISQWRKKCYPDKKDQRGLIAKNMSVRFMKREIIAEIQEMRDEGGNHNHNIIIGDTTGRPSTAPLLPTSPIAGVTPTIIVEEVDTESHMGRTRKSFTAAGSEKNAANDELKKKLRQRPKSAHAKREQFLDVLTAPAIAVEPRVLLRNLEQQQEIESRDPVTVFQYMKNNLPGAKAFKLRSDGYGTKQELDLRKAIKKLDSMDDRKLGMAIVFDPSIVTEGYTVTLRFKYILDEKRIDTHTTSNVGNGNRQAEAAANFATSKGMSTPFSTIGSLQRASSMPTMEAALATSFREGGPISKSSSNLLAFAATADSKGGGTKQKKKFGTFAVKRKSTTVQVDYVLNASRKYKYDLKLSTNPKARSIPVINGMPMFLPGWEGCMPLYIPNGYALCQVLVLPEGEDPTTHWGSSPSSWNASPMSSLPSTAMNSRPGSAFGSRPSTAPTNYFGGGFNSGDTMNEKLTRDTMLQELKDQSLKNPETTLSLSGFAFPAESIYRALHALRKQMEGGVKKKLSNFMVPGGEPALHVASLHGNADAVRQLLENGADVNLKNQPNLMSALHEAVTGGNHDCVKVLLGLGANERQTDIKGNTALHLACHIGDIPCANLLMRSKDSVKVLQFLNKVGKTPLDVVQSNTMRQTVERGMRKHHLVVPINRSKKL